MSQKYPLEQLYYGSVEARLETGKELFCTFGDVITGKTEFQQHLRQLKNHAADLSHHMAVMNLGPLCCRCASQSSGGCCSLFMAGETDALQILMNLLAGVDVRPVRADGKECVYLGDRGCIFLFKPMFCLNYNCTHIHEGAEPAHIRELERLSGVLLTKQYVLEHFLLDHIRKEPV